MTMDMETKNILSKLHAIMAEVDYIQKDKRNQFFGYNYASEAAIKETLHKSLVNNKVIFVVTSAGITSRVEYQTKKGERMCLTDVLVKFTFFDVESGESISGEMHGTGDDGADKGTYKAITGAIKYIMTSMFVIPTGDDPENDGKSSTPTTADVQFSNHNPARKTAPAKQEPAITDYVALINGAKSEQELEAIGTKIKADTTISVNKKATLRAIYEGRVKALQHASESVPTPPTA